MDGVGQQASGDRPHLLRLMPSNFHQAEAIANHLRKQLNNQRRVVLFARDRATDPYVDDMYRALEDQLELLNMSPIEADTANDIQAGDTVVCIGYFKHLAHLRTQITRCKALILTDGCFRAATVRFLKHRIDETRNTEPPPESGTRPVGLFGCRPNRSPECYASEVYSAIRNAHLAFADAVRWEPNPRPDLPPVRDTLRGKVERWLVKRHPTWYNFAGGANRKGGYIVDPLQNKEDLDNWGERLEARDDSDAADKTDAPAGSTHEA